MVSDRGDQCLFTFQCGSRLFFNVFPFPVILPRQQCWRLYSDWSTLEQGHPLSSGDCTLDTNKMVKKKSVFGKHALLNCVVAGAFGEQRVFSAIRIKTWHFGLSHECEDHGV